MSQFLNTSYWSYHVNESMEFDYDKVVSLRKKRLRLYKEMCKEQDNKKRQILIWRIRKIDCKLAIENLKR